MTFDVQQTRDAQFAFADLEPGTLYRAYLNHPAVATSQSTIQFETPDSVAYFTVRDADLSVVRDGRQAVVAGRWNEPLFRRLTDGFGICSYDITALDDFNAQPRADNPNALFYTTADRTELAQYDNVVVGDVCTSLRIQTGADFQPARSFTAREASLALGQTDAGAWHWTVVPFAADVPYGMQAKVPVEWGSSLLTHSATRTLEAMSPVIYLVGHDDLSQISARDVAIGTSPQRSFFDGQLIATTVATPIEPTWLLLDHYLGSVYYLSTTGLTEAAPFQSYVVSTTGTRMRTTTEAVADAHYAQLSVAINAVYQAFGERGLSLPGDATAELLAALTAAEDALTYRSAADDAATDGLKRQLEAALADFIAAQSQGIAPPSTPDAVGPAAYYNLSGQRLSGAKRGIIVVRQGSKTRKMLIK